MAVSDKFKVDAENIPNIKLVITGPGDVGKTSLLKVYALLKKISSTDELLSNVTKVDNPFEETALFDQTIFGLGKRTAEGHEGDLPLLKYSLFTVAGQDRYRDARKVVLQGTDGLIIMLSPLQMEKNAMSISEVMEILGEQLMHIPWVIVVNKIDLVSEVDRAGLIDLVISTGLSTDKDYIDARLYEISALNARNALLQLLDHPEPSKLLDGNGLLKPEYLPEEVRQIVMLIHKLTKATVESKIR